MLILHAFLIVYQSSNGLPTLTAWCNSHLGAASLGCLASRQQGGTSTAETAQQALCALATGQLTDVLPVVQA
jgi:hypothetical protein